MVVDEVVDVVDIVMDTLLTPVVIQGGDVACVVVIFVVVDTDEKSLADENGRDICSASV